MAIKGKKRSRSGRARAPAAAPRPKLIEVKPPLVRRTWFRLTVLSVLVAAVVAGGLAGWAAKRASDEREREQRAVTRVGVQIENAMTFVGQQIPGGASFQVLPEAGSAIVQIQSGDFRERRIRRNVEDWIDRLGQSEQALQGIQTENGDLRRSVSRLLDGVQSYATVVGDLPAVLDVKGRERREMLEDLQQRLGEAAGEIDSGWLIYLNERIEVGLDTGGNPGLQPQLPPGQNPFQPPGPGDAPPG